MKRSTPESSSSVRESSGASETSFSTICSSISKDPKERDRQKQTLIQIAKDIYNLTLSPETQLQADVSTSHQRTRHHPKQARRETIQKSMQRQLCEF